MSCSGTQGQWTIDGLFTGLSSGSHTVELWLTGDAASCADNLGNFGNTVLVTEF